VCPAASFSLLYCAREVLCSPRRVEFSRPVSPRVLFPARQRALSARLALKSLSCRRPRYNLVRPSCWSWFHTMPISSDPAPARRCVIHNRVVKPVISFSTPPHQLAPNTISSSFRASAINPKNRVKKLAARYFPSARQIAWIGKSLPTSRIRVSC
jgi:hypothetical protein